jgi:hypothetical protein
MTARSAKKSALQDHRFYSSADSIYGRPRIVAIDGPWEHDPQPFALSGAFRDY